MNVYGSTNSMTFDDALQAEVSRAEAECEILRHHLDPSDFFHEAGDRPTYSGADVLLWLGY